MICIQTGEIYQNNHVDLIIKACIWALLSAKIKRRIKQQRIERDISLYDYTLWKLMLSSKGMKWLNLVDLSHVMVFLHTGNNMSAMLNFSVSAAPLAVRRQ